MTPRRTPVLVLSALLALAVCLVQTPTNAQTWQSDREVVKIKYPGRSGIVITRTSGDERRLHGTPRSLKKFVRARLEMLYREGGSRPRCATAPTVFVERYHGAGFARVGEGSYAPCPGGGYAITYVRSGGRWHAVLGTQEALRCADLQWFEVPKFIAGRTCMTEDWKPLPYSVGAQPRSSGPVSARRLAELQPGRILDIPVSAFATPAVADEVRALVADGAYVTSEGCVIGGDGSEAGQHLQPGEEGCQIRASYDDNSYAVMYVAAMAVTADGLHVATALTAFAST